MAAVAGAGGQGCGAGGAALTLTPQPLYDVRGRQRLTRRGRRVQWRNVGYEWRVGDDGRGQAAQVGGGMVDALVWEERVQADVDHGVSVCRVGCGRDGIVTQRAGNENAPAAAGGAGWYATITAVHVPWS